MKLTFNWVVDETAFANQIISHLDAFRSLANPSHINRWSYRCRQNTISIEWCFCLCFFSFLGPSLIIVLRLSHFGTYFDLDSLSKTLTRAIIADLASATLVLAFSYWLRTRTWRIFGSRSSNLRWSSLIRSNRSLSGLTAWELVDMYTQIWYHQY